MPWNKQIGRASASECLKRRPRPSFACGEGDLSLPMPVRCATLAAKPPVSGECRFNCLVRARQQRSLDAGMSRSFRETLKNSVALILDRGKSVTWHSLQLRFRLFSVCP
jgi:hypothetical protein